MQSTIRILGFVLVSMLSLTSLTGQVVTVSDLSPSAGPLTSDQLTMVMVANTSTTAVRGSVVSRVRTGSGRMVAEVRSRIFKLSAGETVSSVTIPWFREVAYGANSAGRSLASSGLLPFGSFTVCHEFIEETNRFREISCGEKKSQPVLQLSLIYPQHKTKILENRPILTWEDVSLYSATETTITYSLRLVERLKGQSINTALETNIPLLERRGLRQNQLMYPAEARRLLPEREYAWMVTAFREGNELIGSQRWSFQLEKNAVAEVIPEGKSYAMVDTKINNRPYIFDESIQLGFDNVEGIESLDYKITCLQRGHEPISSLPKVENLTAGLNTVDIPTSAMKLKEGRTYQLEIRTPRGQIYTLQFRYRS